MKILERFRKGPSEGEAADPGEPGARPAAPDEPPIQGYDRLGEKEIGGRLRELSQVELAAVESYERANKARPAVLAKLRYMRSSEPLPGYDNMSPEEISAALADADAQTVKSVRDYERKFAHRAGVLAEAARVLPSAPASAEETRTQEEKDERLREGYAVRKQTAESL